MTVQKRTMIAPGDIIGIEYECSHCHARYAVALEFADRLVSACPNCKEQWISSETPKTSIYADDKALLLFFARLKDVQARVLGATVRFEIKNDIEEKA
jgi:hypothetical protein